MKKNLMIRLGALALILTLITTAIISGTLAKYVSKVTGSDTARVAKFEFNLTDGGTTLNQDTKTGSFDLFTMNNETGVGSSTDKIIAPGTTGDFIITVNNTSEVNVASEFALIEKNNGVDSNKIPVYYTISGSTQRYSDVLTGIYTDGTYEKLNNLAMAMATGLDATDGTKSYNLNWTWDYDTAGTGQSNFSDTVLGEDGTAAVVLDIECTVTQSDT